MPTQPPRKNKQPNTASQQNAASAEHARYVEDYAAAVEGYALDTVIVTFTLETIMYARSFREGTWHPDRRTLFQIANQFRQN